MCSLAGDFNIDLLKSNSNENINQFYNTLTSNFFAPYIMQPTRFASQSLVDNIFINSIEYMSYSGNLTIQISDRLLQFVLLEGFFKEVLPKKINIYERNFKTFNERKLSKFVIEIPYFHCIKIILTYRRIIYIITLYIY